MRDPAEQVNDLCVQRGERRTNSAYLADDLGDRRLAVEALGLSPPRSWIEQPFPDDVAESERVYQQRCAPRSRACVIEIEQRLDQFIVVGLGRQRLQIKSGREERLDVSLQGVSVWSSFGERRRRRLQQANERWRCEQPGQGARPREILARVEQFVRDGRGAVRPQRDTCIQGPQFDGERSEWILKLQVARPCCFGLLVSERPEHLRVGQDDLERCWWVSMREADAAEHGPDGQAKRFGPGGPLDSADAGT